jgi:dCMP deaminase
MAYVCPNGNNYALFLNNVFVCFFDMNEKMNIVEGLDNFLKSWEGKRPSWDEYFICTALLMSTRSPCSRLNVGCVMVSTGEHKNRIIAAGYNGYLAGAPHTSCIRDGHEMATVHAEQNAISDAARRGVSLNGATAYITHFPCINCAKIMISAGIKAVKYLHDYHNDDLVLRLFEESNIEITKL